MIAIGILILSYSYVGMRLIIPLRLARPKEGLLWVFLVLLMLLPLFYIFLRINGIGPDWNGLLSWPTFLSLGFFSLVFVLLIIRDMSLFFLSLVKGLVSRIQKTLAYNRSAMHQPERRGFLIHATNLGIMGTACAFTGYGVYNARALPPVVNVAVPIPGLPEAMEGFRIVQITDIHVSPMIRRPYVQAVVARVNSLHPHIIAFTGDLADGPVINFKNDVAPLKNLYAEYGSFFVTGNHEYYAGVEAWIAEIDGLGLKVLLNEHQVIRHNNAQLLLAGVTDYTGGRFLKTHISDPHKALSGGPNVRPKILLAHQPRSIFAAADAGFDLQICGHTHGGQFFPWQFLVRLQQPYIAGLYRHHRTYIYVSRGTGYWGPPLRLGAPSEITLITLKSKKSMHIRGTL